MAVLAIDAGTTGVTALVVSPDARLLGRGYAEFPQYFPRPGWVEHDPEEIWRATLDAARAALDAADHPVLAAVGLTVQRETACFWDRQSLAAARRAIVWQDRRTDALCAQLREAGHQDAVARTTGLRLDPYFTATKLAWVRDNDPDIWDGVTAGRVGVGTVDAYLLARLSGGRSYATDASNASRTLLFDLAAGGWSESMCELFGVPLTALPEVTGTWGNLARTDPGSFLGLDLPVCGVAGDQQAALFGQACYAVGEAKCTYGTGSFVLVNTGAEVVRSDAGLLSTVAWQAPGGGLTYALEGAIFVTGAAVQWLRDGLQIIETAAQTEELARSVPDTGGVVFVPALTGLGAPDWDAGARGTLLGLTRGTTRAHLVRATLEAIAFEVRDVISTFPKPISMLRADGGASANDFLMQLQADQLGVQVDRPEVVETTGMGAAFLAGLGAGVWSSTGEVADAWRLDRRFEPGARDENAYRRWRAGVDRSKGWAALVD